MLAEDCIRTARAKGLARRHIFWGHVLRPASLPVIASLGAGFGVLLGYAAIVDWVFALVGVGQALLADSYRQDRPKRRSGAAAVGHLLAASYPPGLLTSGDRRFRLIYAAAGVNLLSHQRVPLLMAGLCPAFTLEPPWGCPFEGGSGWFARGEGDADD